MVLTNTSKTIKALESLKLVSVLICTYNGEKYIADLIKSILFQTYINLEIVVVDDASTDSTVEILQQYAAQDYRIVLHSNKINLGLNKNFEKGLKLCNGEIIFISDQDDIWLPNKIDKMLINWTSPTLLCHHWAKKFKGSPPSDLKIKKLERKFDGTDVAKLFFANTVQGHTIAVKRDILRLALPFEDDVYYDWWLACCAAIHGGVSFIDEVLMFHRRHDSSAFFSQKKPTAWVQDTLALLHRVKKEKKLSPSAKGLAERYIVLLTQPTAGKGPLKLFWFYLSHYRTTFYYKHRIFPWVSYLKHSWRKTRAVQSLQTNNI